MQSHGFGIWTSLFIMSIKLVTQSILLNFTLAVIIQYLLISFLSFGYIFIQDGRVNALYSTPSIYTDAKYAESDSWPLKEDDYFP